MSKVSRRTVKTVAIVLAVYALLVVAFESLLGYFQPEAQGTLVITTVDDEGKAHDRVLSGLASDGKPLLEKGDTDRISCKRKVAPLGPFDVSPQLALGCPPYPVGFDHQGQFVDIPSLLPYPAPVTARLFPGDPSLLDHGH